MIVNYFQLCSGRAESVTVPAMNVRDASILRGCNVAQWQSFLYRDYIFPKERMTDDAEISPLVKNRGQHLKLVFGRKQREPHPTVWTSAYTEFNLVVVVEGATFPDLQHSGNMFIVTVVLENMHTIKTIEYFCSGADQEHKM